MQTQIIILAAGKGRRMNNDDIPKVLLPLAGKPVIMHLLQELEKLEAGKNPIIVVGYKSSLVQKELGKKYIYVLDLLRFNLLCYEEVLKTKTNAYPKSL